MDNSPRQNLDCKLSGLFIENYSFQWTNYC